MGNLEKTLLSESMFPGIKGLRFKKEARDFDAFREFVLGVQHDINQYDGPVNTLACMLKKQ